MYRGLLFSGSAIIFCALLETADCQDGSRCLTRSGQNGSCTWSTNCNVYRRAFMRLKQDDEKLPTDVRKLMKRFNCDPDHAYNRRPWNVHNSQPVCLPVSQELQEMRLNLEYPVLTGWGLTDKDEEGNRIERGNRPSTKLLKIDLPIVTNKKCGQIYNRSIIGVSFRHICAGGEPDYSSCSGDSKGPLLIKTNNTRWNYVQIGILSGGALRCGIKNAPSISTRVAHYMDWILDQLEP